jgi:hypothetical protein
VARSVFPPHTPTVNCSQVDGRHELVLARESSGRRSARTALQSLVTV